MANRTNERMRGAGARALAVAIAAAVLAPVPAPAATTTISMDEYSFSPRRPTTVVIDGATRYRWRNDGATDHNTVRLDIVGWQSPMLDPGDEFCCKTFRFASTYPYMCTIHGSMTGAIKMAPFAGRTLADGSYRDDVRAGRKARVWVATKRLPDRFVIDIQRRRPGGSWSLWRSDVSSRSVGFTPKNEGTVLFRARLREPATGDRARWSPRAELTVLP